jgi:hypothetical protein
MKRALFFFSFACCVLTTRHAASAADLRDGMVSYWPMDEVQGQKTPDVVRGYDLELVNLTAADFVAGKRGKAARFTGSRMTMLERVHLATDELPIYRNPNFTVSFWVNGAPDLRDLRIFTEGSKSSNTPWFSLGTPNNGQGSSLDVYTRTDANQNSGHDYSTLPVLDGAWHHVVYVQQEQDGVIEVTLYVDGVKDDIVVDARRPATLNTISIGGALRTDRTWYFTGMVDEVAVWKRALNQAEVTLLNTQGTPSAGAVAQPLAIRSFIAELPAVAKGHSNTLRWDVSKDATEVTIDQGIGNVLSKTVVGLGSITLPITDSKTYTLTIRRGTEQVSARTSIAAVDGVGAGWALLDNFDTYQAGSFTNGYWSDTRANAAVSAIAGNKMLDLRGNDRTVILPLRGLSILEGQRRTLFARMSVEGDPVEPILSYFGVTDRSLRYFSDFNDTGGFGPCVIPNNQGGNAELMIGSRNGVWGNQAPDNVPPALELNQAYYIWIDVYNGPPVPDTEQGDRFSVFLQKVGSAQRMPVFPDHLGNRNPAGTPAGNGGDPALPNMDKLMIGNNTANAILFDDIFISTTGYNSTIPFGQSSGAAPSLSISRSAADLELKWTAGTLEWATSILGPWSAVPASAAPSYKVTLSGNQRYFRVRQ